VFFMIMMTSFVAAGRSAMYLAALIAAWTICMMFVRAAQFHGSLYYGPSLRCYYFLPIPDEGVFRVQWRQFLWNSLWSAADFALLYFLLVLKMGGRWNSIEAGLCLGLLQWLFIPPMALVLMVLFPGKVLYTAFWMLPLATFGLLWIGPEHEALFGQLAGLACWIPPMGPIFHLLGIVKAGGLSASAWPCATGIIALAASSFAWQKARRNYSMPENQADESKAGAELFRRSAGEAQGAIRSRQFISGMDWRNLRIVERGLSRLLTQRERVIAEFMTAAKPGWTAGLKTFVIVLAAAVGCYWFLAVACHVKTNPILLLWVCFFLAAKLVGGWSGFAIPQGAGIQCPVYAGYPIGFWELVSVILKIDLARFLIALPLGCCAIAVLQRFIPGIANAEPVAIKIIAVCIMISPIVPIMLMSSGTNDSQRPRFTSVIAALLLFLVLIASGVAVIVVSSWNLAAMFVAVGLAASMLALFLYGRSFNLTRFDLIPVPQGNPIQPEQ
jgi:hypothetical protein